MELRRVAHNERQIRPTHPVITTKPSKPPDLKHRFTVNRTWRMSLVT